MHGTSSPRKTYYCEEEDKNEERWAILECQSCHKYSYCHHGKGKIQEETATLSEDQQAISLNNIRYGLPIGRYVQKQGK
jgi:hypothetical protein